ncbi:hypothetical protein CKR_2542 [Clostridium kluyveri NBRC 12016]|uniref:Uncharacterized protein n=1 Tax=Clostridium kluyveri (strain NBRC 12016) TaxID=583346 RepID=B9E518_CLOK1|nr:hypothetical protein CKR_2542 [Clostridium kluyveri NBRC 12016]
MVILIFVRNIMLPILTFKISYGNNIFFYGFCNWINFSSLILSFGSINNFINFSLNSPIAIFSLILIGYLYLRFSVSFSIVLFDECKMSCIML